MKLRGKHIVLFGGLSFAGWKLFNLGRAALKLKIDVEKAEIHSVKLSGIKTKVGIRVTNPTDKTINLDYVFADVFLADKDGDLNIGQIRQTNKVIAIPANDSTLLTFDMLTTARDVATVVFKLLGKGGLTAKNATVRYTIKSEGIPFEGENTIPLKATV